MEHAQPLYTLPEGLTKEEIDCDPTDLSTFNSVDDYLAYVCIERLQMPKTEAQSKSPSKHKTSSCLTQDGDEMFTANSIKRSKIGAGADDAIDENLVENTTKEDISRQEYNQSIERKLNLTTEDCQKIEAMIDNMIHHVGFLKENIPVANPETFKNPDLDLTIAHTSPQELVKFFDNVTELLQEPAISYSEEIEAVPSYVRLLGKKTQKRIFYHLIRTMAVENFLAESTVIASARGIAKIIHKHKDELFGRSKLATDTCANDSPCQSTSKMSVTASTPEVLVTPEKVVTEGSRLDNFETPTRQEGETSATNTTTVSSTDPQKSLAEESFKQYSEQQPDRIHGLKIICYIFHEYFGQMDLF